MRPRFARCWHARYCDRLRHAARAASQTAGLPASSLIRVPGDITDMANVAQAMLVHKPDAVIHCAAIVGVLSSLGSPINIVRVNVEGSLNVFEAMRLGGVKRCIHISSEEAYGAFRADKIDETQPAGPGAALRDLQGGGGAARTQLPRSARAGGHQPAHVVGLWPGPAARSHPEESRWMRHWLDASFISRPARESAIDHTYVDDVVAAILTALDHQRASLTTSYNVASGDCADAFPS